MLLATAAPSPGPKTNETKGFKIKKAGRPAKVNPPATVTSQDSSPRKISLTSAKSHKKTARKRKKKSDGSKSPPPKRKRSKTTSLGNNSMGFRVSKTACLGLSNYSMPPEYHGLMLCVQRICATPLHLSTMARPTKKVVPQQQPDVPTHQQHRPGPPCSPQCHVQDGTRGVVHSNEACFWQQ